MSRFVIAFAIAVAFMGYESVANAQHSVNDRKAAISTVACPANTCGPRGYRRALNLDLCKPENCRK